MEFVRSLPSFASLQGATNIARAHPVASGAVAIALVALACVAVSYARPRNQEIGAAARPLPSAPPQRDEDEGVDDRVEVDDDDMEPDGDARVGDAEPAGALPAGIQPDFASEVMKPMLEATGRHLDDTMLSFVIEHPLENMAIADATSLLTFVPDDGCLVRDSYGYYQFCLPVIIQPNDTPYARDLNPPRQAMLVARQGKEIAIHVLYLMELTKPFCSFTYVSDPAVFVSSLNRLLRFPNAVLVGDACPGFEVRRRG